MRIDRIEASRHKRGRVLVFLEDGACLKVTEQELLDFGLRAGDELDEGTLGRLKEAAGVSNVKVTAADLVQQARDAVGCVPAPAPRPRQKSYTGLLIWLCFVAGALAAGIGYCLYCGW